MQLCGADTSKPPLNQKLARNIATALFIGSALLSVVQPSQAMHKPDPQMKAVLDQLAALHPKPIEKLTAAEARKPPGPPDAVKALLKKQGRSTAPQPVGSVSNHTIPGPTGGIPVRVYTPMGNGPFPVLVYFHGGVGLLQVLALTTRRHGI